jgi:hypothetical protein
MEKEIFSFSKKSVLFILFTLLLFSQSSYSQCNNAPPTGDPAQEFCRIDDKTVADLVALGGAIVWYDSLTNGRKAIQKCIH